MAVEQLSLLLVGTVALSALLLAIWQLKVARKLALELTELRQLLAAATVPKQKPSFSNQLDQVEREQKVAPPPRSSSEKYRYAASLANQGVDPQGIAAALQLAPAEVEQLLQLVQIKQPAGKDLPLKGRQASSMKNGESA